jgi:uncharacterized membrane protein YeiH
LVESQHDFFFDNCIGLAWRHCFCGVWWLGRVPKEHGYCGFWVREPSVLLVSVSVGVVMFFVAHLLQSRMRLLLWLDAIGLAIFCVTGAHTALAVGVGPSIAVAMGVASATFGGIIRDVLGGESPMVLRKEIYVTAALFGALAAMLVTGLQFDLATSLVAGFVTAFAIRAAALHWNLSLPRYESRVDS